MVGGLKDPSQGGMDEDPARTNRCHHGSRVGNREGHCPALAHEGMRLALCDKDPAGPRRRRSCAQQVEVSLHPIDVSDRSAMRALPAAVAAVHGGIHLLVNNAASPAHGLARPDRRGHRVGDGGELLGCRVWLQVLPAAPSRGRRGPHREHLQHLRHRGNPHAVELRASKFAVRGFTESLWEELRGLPVGDNGSPGRRTNNAANARGGDQRERDQMVKAFRRIPFTPEQAAERIVRAVKRDQKRLLFTRESILGDLLKRIFPVWGNHLFVDLVKKTFRMQGRLEAEQQRAIARARSALEQT